MAKVPWKFVSFVSLQRRGPTVLEHLVQYIHREVGHCEGPISPFFDGGGECLLQSRSECGSLHMSGTSGATYMVVLVYIYHVFMKVWCSSFAPECHRFIVR